MDAWQGLALDPHLSRWQVLVIICSTFIHRRFAHVRLSSRRARVFQFIGSLTIDSDSRYQHCTPRVLTYLSTRRTRDFGRPFS